MNLPTPRPTVEVVADEMDLGALHINVNAEGGTRVFVSLSERFANGVRYTDLEMKDGNVTIYNAGGR